MEKDALIEKCACRSPRTRIGPADAERCCRRRLVHDKDILMREVTELDSRLRVAVQEKEAAFEANRRLEADVQAARNAAQVSDHLMHSVEDQARQHSAEREFLAPTYSASWRRSS